jgi:uncharacterized membrane protein YeaQ/YmgE (transglycosylase-associated protein family)
MPNTGDHFITILKQAHLEWGSHRHTDSRGTVYGEGYLHIPVAQARRLNITNNNAPGANNIYSCNSADGYLVNVILTATGGVIGGTIYAKNFHGKGNLKLLGDWFHHIGAMIGDQIEISWVSPTEISLRKI